MAKPRRTVAEHRDVIMRTEMYLSGDWFYASEAAKKIQRTSEYAIQILRDMVDKGLLTGEQPDGVSSMRYKLKKRTMPKLRTRTDEELGIEATWRPL